MSRIDPQAVTAAAVELVQVRERSNWPVDHDAWRAKNFLLGGRMDDAAEIVMPSLIEGTASPTMQKLAAALYYFARGKTGRGPREKPRPRCWNEIGERYDALRKAGLTYGPALERMEREFSMSRSSVETSLRFYQVVNRKIDELSKA